MSKIPNYPFEALLAESSILDKPGLGMYTQDKYIIWNINRTDNKM